MGYFELGRSLVEVLGTLAIMGIISITTIVGFGALMNKHHANTLIEEAQKRATVIAGQIGFEKTPSLVEFNKYNTTSAGEFGKEVTTSDSVLQFGIPVSGVKKGVCQSIIGAIGDKTALRRLSPANNFQTALTECEDDNSFLMVYNNDLGTNDKLEPPTPCYEDIDCKTECATCQIPEGDFKGICAGECNANCKLEDSCGDNECVVCDPNTKTCQNRCIEVEYLESTGTQWIDTGYIPHGLNPYINADFEILSANNRELFGTHRQTLWRINFENSLIYYNYNSEASGARNGVSLNERHSGSFGKSIIIDDKLIWKTTSTSPSFDYSSNTLSISLFLGNHGVGSKMRIYSFQIYDSGNFTRDFIPVIAPFKPKGKQNCMFDKVTKKLFCNKGSGADFKIPGDITIPWARDNEEGSCKYDIDCASEGECSICDPSTKTCQNGCTEIEYLQSTGTQYIDTGYTFQNIKHKTVSKISNTTAGAQVPSWLFGSYSGEKRSGGLAIQTDETKIGIGLGDIKAGSTTFNINVIGNTPATLMVDSLSSSKFSFTGGSTDYVEQSYTGDTLTNLSEYIFCAHGQYGPADNSCLKIYSHKIYDNDILVRDFIPVLDLDGVPAMYDKVEKKLYYNLGSGNFLYGAAK